MNFEEDKEIGRGYYKFTCTSDIVYNFFYVLIKFDLT